jgi:hypothetical protein
MRADKGREIGRSFTHGGKGEWGVMERQTKMKDTATIRGMVLRFHPVPFAHPMGYFYDAGKKRL